MLKKFLGLTPQVLSNPEVLRLLMGLNDENSSSLMKVLPLLRLSWFDCDKVSHCLNRPRYCSHTLWTWTFVPPWRYVSSLLTPSDLVWCSVILPKVPRLTRLFPWLHGSFCSWDSLSLGLLDVQFSTSPIVNDSCMSMGLIMHDCVELLYWSVSGLSLFDYPDKLGYSVTWRGRYPANLSNQWRWQNIQGTRWLVYILHTASILPYTFGIHPAIARVYHPYIQIIKYSALSYLVSHCYRVTIISCLSYRDRLSVLSGHYHILSVIAIGLLS